jgi:hypothetical protein
MQNCSLRESPGPVESSRLSLLVLILKRKHGSRSSLQRVLIVEYCTSLVMASAGLINWNGACFCWLPLSMLRSRDALSVTSHVFGFVRGCSAMVPSRGLPPAPKRRPAKASTLPPAPKRRPTKAAKAAEDEDLIDKQIWQTDILKRHHHNLQGPGSLIVRCLSCISMAIGRRSAISSSRLLLCRMRSAQLSLLETPPARPQPCEHSHTGGFPEVCPVIQFSVQTRCR